MHVERPQVAALHRLEHRRQVPAALRAATSVRHALELRAQRGVLDVLDRRRSLFGQRAHVAAALHVVLAAQRVDARSRSGRRGR